MTRKGAPVNTYLEDLLTIGPFGGLDVTTAPYYVGKNNFVDGENFIPNQNYGGYVTTLGRQNAFTGTLPSEPFGITKMERPGQPDVYIFAVNAGGNGALYYAILGGSYTPLALPETLTQSQQTYFAQADKWIFMTNGTDRPLKIDTSLNVTFWGIIAPTSAPILANGASGGLLGTYYYTVTFANANQESSEGTISLPITVVNQDVNISGIPTSTDPQVTERNIYRVGGALGTWQLIGTLHDNTTTTFVDTIPDNQVTGQFLTPRRDPPPAFTAIAQYQERIWGFGIPEDPSSIWWSNYQEPWGFDSVDHTDDAGQNSFGDNAVNLVSIGSQLLLLKTHSLYAVYGQTDADFQVNFVAAIGCISGPSAVGGYGTAWWMSNQGVWMYSSSGFQQLSDGTFQQSNIKSSLDVMTPADKQASVGFLYDRMYFLSFPTDVDKTFFWDSRSQQWFRLGFSCAQAYFDLESVVPVIATNRIIPGEVDQWFASETDLGNAITSYLTSRVSDSDALESTKIYRYAIVQAPGQPGATATVYVVVNPGLQQSTFVNTVNLGIPGPTDTGTRHLISLPQKMKGFEVQMKVVIIATQQTIIERASIRGWIDRMYIQKG